MSGVVSLELFKNRLGTGSIGFTQEGGIYETFINNTGLSVKGTIVVASTNVTNGVDIAPPNSQMPLGVIYDDNVSNGLPVRVVVLGKAEVLLKDGESSSNGFWCGVSDTQGRMYQLSTVPVDGNDRKIGYSLESKVIGNNVKALVQININ